MCHLVSRFFFFVIVHDEIVRGSIIYKLTLRTLWYIFSDACDRHGDVTCVVAMTTLLGQ